MATVVPVREEGYLPLRAKENTLRQGLIRRYFASVAAVIILAVLIVVLAVVLSAGDNGNAPPPPPTPYNDRPIVAILTQPSEPPYDKRYGENYLVSSYVKFIESAGARVIPLHWNQSHEDLHDILSHVNGVLLPGGGSSLTGGFFDTGRLILNHVMETNANGTHLPLWGTCMGFEFLHVLVGGSDVLTSGFDSKNISWPLNVTSHARKSRLFKGASDTVWKLLTTAPLTYNSHHSGITPDDFYGSTELKAFFNVLSTNMDRKGKEFISVVEAKDYPIYATQYHPEKNVFEWLRHSAIPHSPDAVLVARYHSDFFVSEARKNVQAYPHTEQEDAALIYNYDPVFTGAEGYFSEQTYFFHESCWVLRSSLPFPPPCHVNLCT